MIKGSASLARVSRYKLLGLRMVDELSFQQPPACKHGCLTQVYDWFTFASTGGLLTIRKTFIGRFLEHGR